MSTDREQLNVLPWGDRSKHNNHVLWNNLILAQCEDSCYVTQWNQRQMTVFQVDEKEVRDITISTLQCATQICQVIMTSFSSTLVS